MSGMEKRRENRYASCSSYVDMARAACGAIMDRYDPPQLPPASSWHYHQGVFLHGMIRLWERTKEEPYYRYVRGYADHLIDRNGNFLFSRDELDAIQAGLLLFPLYRRSGDARYRTAAQRLRHLFGTLNRTSEGGFWHKDKYPNQMWLDGLYMGGVFAATYAEAFGEAELFALAVEQERLMRMHMKDPATGLLYHAWDESRQAPWADPATGRSPEFWGRAIGWYGMAVADIAEKLPAGQEGREELIRSWRELAAALVRYQDGATGLWHQIVDKAGRPDNWLETSCSSLFVYTLAKGVADGHLDAACWDAARRGYNGLLDRMAEDGEGRLVMPDICVGTSAGDYAHYVSRPRSENDLHGVGAFVLACLEMDRAAERMADSTYGKGE